MVLDHALAQLQRLGENRSFAGCAGILLHTGELALGALERALGALLCLLQAALRFAHAVVGFLLSPPDRSLVVAVIYHYGRSDG